jgi:hypothetical protein
MAWASAGESLFVACGRRDGRQQGQGTKILYEQYKYSETFWSGGELNKLV